jgi:hypothetical protein
VEQISTIAKSGVFFTIFIPWHFQQGYCSNRASITKTYYTALEGCLFILPFLQASKWDLSEIIVVKNYFTWEGYLFFWDQI